MNDPRVSFTRLEKAAVDNGFDLVKEPVAAWLPVSSSHAPVDLWLTVDGNGHAHRCPAAWRPLSRT